MPAVTTAWIVVALLATTQAARAQPFFGGVTAYDPEISTAQSGALFDAQAVVSADRKYVTLNFRGTESRLIALREFQIVETQPLGGFVGGIEGGDAGAPAPGGGGGAGGGAGGGGFSAAPASPAEIERRAIAARSVLSRRGMFLLKKL